MNQPKQLFPHFYDFQCLLPLDNQMNVSRPFRNSRNKINAETNFKFRDFHSSYFILMKICVTIPRPIFIFLTIWKYFQTY